ncbi:MAG: 1,4-dihydroxy-6-naphthoate synthase [bacterium]|nr:1,4-dihydroxy-6-naphthoate synthase [bacterium]
MTLRIGISTCPNDTFAFHGLMTGAVDAHGLELEFTLGDVEELNRALLAGEFDLAKGSFAAALVLGDERVVLPAGSALGFGVGPLLLARENGVTPENVPADGRVLCPGEHTTATLLYRLFHPARGRLEQVVFSAIMPALQAGEAELGVCIHEGRFTWREQGLACVEDLGTLWESASGAPLPLGGLFARRDLGSETLAALSAAVRGSIEYGLAHRDATLATMREHAQELDDDVIFAHVDLYVNAWTRDLGDAGRQALATLAQRARDAGLAAPGAALEVFEP